MVAYLKLFGRLAITLIFFLSIFKKIGTFNQTVQFMKANGMTFITEFWLVGAIFLIGFGSLSFILGWKLRWGGGSLLIFLIAATAVFHLNFSDQTQTLQMLKNLAIVGGILSVMGNGAGKFSLDQYLIKINNRK